MAFIIGGFVITFTLCHGAKDFCFSSKNGKIFDLTSALCIFFKGITIDLFYFSNIQKAKKEGRGKKNLRKYI